MLKLRPQFVKLDVKHFHEVLPWVVNLVKAVRARPIIEKVETGKDLLLVRKNDVCLIQGKILESVRV